jgi:hypothetical protein
MDYTPGLYSVTDDANTPSSITAATLRRDLEAWVATLRPMELPTDLSGPPVHIQLSGRRYQFILHAEVGGLEVRETDPSTYVCTLADGSRVQIFSRAVEPVAQPFVPPSSGQSFRVELLAVPMSLTVDQHPTLPRYVAFIRGFLDEHHDLDAYIEAPTSVRREQLIASFASLTAVRDEPTSAP